MVTGLRLFDELADQAVLDHRDAEAAGIHHLLDKGHAIAVGALDDREIRAGDGIRVRDDDGAVDILAGQLERVGLAEQLALFDKAGRHGIVGADEALDLGAEVPDDEDELLRLQDEEGVDDVGEDGLAGHHEQGFGFGERVGAQPGAKPGQRDDHLHGNLLPGGAAGGEAESAPPAASWRWPGRMVARRRAAVNG